MVHFNTFYGTKCAIDEFLFRIFFYDVGNNKVIALLQVSGKDKHTQYFQLQHLDLSLSVDLQEVDIFRDSNVSVIGKPLINIKDILRNFALLNSPTSKAAR